MSASEPAFRHVPKLLELPSEGAPVYRCQLCRRQGTLEEMKVSECPARSGVIRRVGAPATPQVA